jgi:VWFA-related protein
MTVRQILRFAFAVSMALGVSAAAQENASPAADQAPFFRSTTRAVVLDVVVIGPDGNPVTDLKQSDFHLVEDNRLENIQYFRPPTLQTAATTQSAGRTVILVDELNSQFADLGYAEYSVRKLLGRSGQLAEPTSLMVLTGSGLKVMQDYTKDGATLLNALHTHRNDITHSLLDQNLSKQSETNDIENLEKIQHIESITLGALAQLSEANMSSDMRQTIVWITPGIEQPSIAMAFVGTSNLGNLGPALRQISDIMLRSRTVLYAVDPQGVGMGHTTPYVPINALSGSSFVEFLQTIGDNGQTGLSDITLSTLTRSTGGRYFYGRNDVDVEIATSMAMGSSSYMLSYAPSNHAFHGEYRKIQITVAKPGCVVITRPGYYALPIPTAASEQLAKYQIDHAITSRLDYASLAVTVTLGQVVDRKQQITLTVDPRGLRWERQTNGNYDTQISIVAVTFDQKGKALYSVKRSMRGDMAAGEFEANRDKPWKIAMDVPVDPKQNRIRVVVRDQRSGQIGSAESADLASAASMKQPSPQ